jgi:NAD(P)-dependent dehydrogenase (short-subunit alcohol dehydrogenase family)
LTFFLFLFGPFPFQSCRHQFLTIIEFVSFPLYSIIQPLSGDVTSPDSLQAAATRVREEVGYINLLITNAGTPGPGLKGIPSRPTVSDFVQAAWTSPPPDFNRVYEVNCTAAYYTILAFLELLDLGNQRKTTTKNDTPYVKSQVIATASMAGFLRDARFGFAYSSSKAALVSLIKTFATYCVPWGIRFNAVALGRELNPPKGSYIIIGLRKANRKARSKKCFHRKCPLRC